MIEGVHKERVVELEYIKGMVRGSSETEGNKVRLPAHRIISIWRAIALQDSCDSKGVGLPFGCQTILFIYSHSI